MLVLGNVLFHPGVAPIRCHQDRCVAEVLKRDEAVSFVEELDLPAPLPTLEVFDVGRRVDPGLSAVPSAKYDGLYLAVATQPRRGVGLRVNLAALVDQSADNEPVVLISEVNVDQIRSVLPHVNQFPARAVVRRLDDGRTREPGIVGPGAVGDALVDRVEAADARGCAFGQVLNWFPGLAAIGRVVKQSLNVLTGRGDGQRRFEICSPDSRHCADPADLAVRPGHAS